MNMYAPAAAAALTMTSSGSSDHSSLTLRLLILPGLDEVAEAADRADADARGLELRAQARDVHLDRVGRDALVPAGHGARDLVLAHDRVDVREQVFEDRVLALRQVERLAPDRGALLREVDGERPVLDGARAQRPSAARERGDARDELRRREGLGEVIVGADGEAVHAIGHRIARSEHEHRLLAAAPAQALEP